jgi:hypothetical protein
MEIVKAITNIESAEFSLRCIDVDEEAILSDEFTLTLTTLRTWKARFRNSLTIKAARSDKGTPRT